MYYFTSDTHFNDESIIKRAHRPFSCVKEHDDTIIANINKTVSKDDTLFCIGDFTTFNPELTDAWVKGFDMVKRINCSTVLVMGNNEWRVVNNMFAGDFSMFKHYCTKLGFTDVVEETKVSSNGKEYSLCHIPYIGVTKETRVHGHIHRLVSPYTEECGMNVSVDLHHFLPVSEDDINWFIDQYNGLKGEFEYESRNN